MALTRVPTGAAHCSRRWWSSAGVWLGIGASPAALVLGASLADRHEGALPVSALAVAAVVAVGLLFGQGRIGLVPPHGDGGTLAQVLPRYLPRIQRAMVGCLLVAAMVGWLSFNAGLGGAAVAALTGTTQAIGVAAFGLPLLLLALSGMARWNVVAVVATASALVLIAQVGVDTAGDPAARIPLTAGLGDPLLALADVAAVVGYVSVFSVRAPDFTAGMRGPGDVAACVALLVVPLLVVTALGALMWWTTGGSDLVAELERSRVGTVLVALAMVAPALTAFFSGGLAVESVTPWRFHTGVLAVAVPGLLLGAAGLHQHLLGLLLVLGSALPALVVPMAVEARARRRGLASRPVPAWSWIPASAVAVLLTVLAVNWAPVVGLALAAVATATWRILAGSDGRRNTATAPRCR